MTTTQEYEARAEALCQALESGRFFQAREMLHDHRGGYCCLGVACEVFRDGSGEGQWDFGEFFARDSNSSTDMPGTVRNWFGFRESNGLFVRGGERHALFEGCPVLSLVSLNDIVGMDLGQIAAFIRLNKANLFTWAGEPS